MGDPLDFLTTGEAASHLGVSVQTVRRWEKSGHLAAVRTPGNQRRFRRADVEALLDPSEQAAAG
jgi:excisionase family DNA binding protein